MNCYHYKECGNKAVYKLKIAKNRNIHVCEDCDENYSICNECGYIEPFDEMTRLNPEDEYRTCRECERKIIEKLKGQLKEKTSIDYSSYKKMALLGSKEELFNNSYKYAVAGEWLCFFENNFYENYDENINILNWLLSLNNIIDTLTEDVACKDYVEFTSDGFVNMFEDIIKNLYKMKIN